MAKLLFLIMFISLIGSQVSNAQDRIPKAYFGKYGIEYHSTLAEYQKYVGQTVKYIKSSTPQKIEKIEFLNKGGKFDTEYTISKISGNDSKLIITLVEKGKRKKIKMMLYSKEHYYFSMMYYYEKNRYYITKSFTVPLLLIDKFNEDKTYYLGKMYPSNPNSTVKFEVTDMIMKEKEGEYPIPSIVLLNKIDGSTKYCDLNYIFVLHGLGKIFDHPKFKCSYTVIDVEFDKDPFELIYTVKNSINGKIKKINSLHADKFAFIGDDSGTFITELTKVEKPSNPEIRYGKTTSITEKDITKYSYADNFIDLLIFASNRQFNFVLKNISDNTLKIIWNDAVFVDVDGSTSKVIHSGIKYMDKEKEQPATSIIRNSKLDELVVPANNIYFDEYKKEWSVRPLHTNVTKNGQIIKLMLPIQIKDVINEYIFEFTLTHKYDHPELIAETDQF